MKLTVLIVSYNTRAMTLECLKSLRLQTREDLYETIVVDNASTDGSADAIAAEFPDVRLIAQPENMGFAAANNVAAKLARGQLLLLLNPDTVVLDRAVERLLDFAIAHPDASIVGGRTLFADGTLNASSCWRRATPWSLFCIAVGLTSAFSRSGIFARESYGSWRRDTVRRVDIVSGCFFMIRRPVWEALGGFDPVFFMYGEEADLCLRAASLGHGCLVCPEATIVHYGGASERVRADKMVKLFRAKAQLAERHWSPALRWFGVAGLDLWALTRLAAFGALSLCSATRTEAYATWKQIWQRRREWRVRPSDRPVARLGGSAA